MTQLWRGWFESIWSASKYHGYQILDRQGRLLHKPASVSMPRWSPDGGWPAVSRWSRELPYQLALVESRQVARVGQQERLTGA